MNVRDIFFKEISKEEALKRFADNNNESELYILRDDLTESLIEEESEIEEAEEPIGAQLEASEIQSRKTEAYTQLYQKLEELKKRTHVDYLVESVITEIMEAINYIEALGF